METSSPASLLSFSSSEKNSRPAMSLSVEFCVVCGDRASGRHYGAISCEGCKGFFKRSIRKQLGYTCRGSKDCEVTKHHRNRCQYCRLQKCLSMGMRSDSVQSERKPASDKKSESPSLLTTANLFLRSDLSANSALSASGQTLPSPGLPWNTDLSTLASVVTSLASIRPDAFASAAVQNSSLQTPVKVKMEEDDDSEDSASTNGEMVNSALHLAKENLITKAFDTMAKNMNGGNQGAAGADYEDDPLMELDGPIIADGNVPFHLTTPSPMPVFLNAHYICESASRLLFLSVHWARSIAAFQLLPSELQISLVRGCWSELFVLGMSQCCHVMSLPAILTAIITQLQASIAQDKVPTQRVKQVTEHVLKLQDYVNSMSRLQIDENEYAYLKALVLFSPDHAGSSHSRHMERIHDRLLRELQAYVSQTWPQEAEQRFPKLLLRLPLLRSLQPALMEELFFAGLIGAVHIDSVIPYILKMESTEYNGQLSNNGGAGQQPSSPAASNHRNSPV